MVVHGSGDVGDVLVKAECRFQNDIEVFDMVGVCYWLVVNDGRWRCGR